MKSRLPTVIFIVLFASCSKKSNPDTPISILNGTYGLVSKTVQSQCAVVNYAVNNLLIVDTTINYITENNKGSIIINSDNIITNNLSYTVHDTSYTQLFQNTMMVGSATVASAFSYSSDKAVIPFKIIGTDSFYYPKLQELYMPDTLDNVTVKYNGEKFSLSNDTLRFTCNVNQSGPYFWAAPGVNALYSLEATIITTYKKE